MNPHHIKPGHHHIKHVAHKANVEQPGGHMTHGLSHIKAKKVQKRYAKKKARS